MSPSRVRKIKTSLQRLTGKKGGGDMPVFHSSDARRATYESELEALFARYTTDQLVNVEADAFEREITSRIGSTDAAIKHFRPEELDKQRDLSIKFHWGHDHDFGSFKMPGRMARRHIQLMADFHEQFGVAPESYVGRDVLDVGCWTGGTTLLLAALGSRIDALEEVPMYADTTRYLLHAFDLEKQASVSGTSLYKCDDAAFKNKYDRVYFPGVIYHLSDPVLALRVLYNTLREGGDILVESAGIEHHDAMCLFEGNAIYHSGTKEELSRGGWNWFLPSPLALYRMLAEAGFEDITTYWHAQRKRVFAYGRKTSHNGICKAGLSVPEID